MVVMAKVLSPELNAQFLVFWSVLFWVFGSLGGIQFETVRSTRTAALAGDEAMVVPATHHVRVVPAGLGVATGVVAIFFLSSLLWAPRVFGSDWLLSVVVVALAAIVYGGYTSVVGVLGGQGRWVSAAVLMVADPLVRSVAIVIAALALSGLVGVKLAAGVATLTWVVLVLVFKGYRSILGSRGDTNVREYVGKTSQAVVATLASTALVVGFPTLLGLVEGNSIIQESAGLLFAISMTRAPLMLPLNAFQSMIVAHFVKRGGSPRVVGRIVLAVLGLGVLASIVAGIIGPPLLGLVRPEYRLGPLLVGGLTLGAAFLCLVVLTGTLALANNQHTVYMTGWVVAIVVTIGMLWIPWTLSVTVIVALIGGSSCGVIVHVTGMMAIPRTSDRGTEEQ